MSTILGDAVTAGGSGGGGNTGLSCFTYLGSFTPSSDTVNAPDITVPSTAKAVIITETKTHSAYVGGNVFGVMHIVAFNGTVVSRHVAYGITSWDNDIYFYLPTGTTIEESSDNLVVSVVTNINSQFFAGHTYEYGYMEW